MGAGASLILTTSLAVRGLSLRLAGPICSIVLLAPVFLDIGPRLSLAGGFLGLAIAGFLWHRSRIGSVSVAVLGAVLVMYRGLDESAAAWVRPVGVAAILVAAWCMTRYEENGNRPHSVLLLAVTLIAIWVNVPDTEIPRLFLGGWLGVLPGLFLAGLPALGAWAPAVAAQLVWMTAAGGVGRSGSIIGGWASMGILLLRPTSAKPLLAFLIHGGLVAVTARVAGLRESPIQAGMISLAAFAAAAALLRLTDSNDIRSESVVRL